MGIWDSDYSTNLVTSSRSVFVPSDKSLSDHLFMTTFESRSQSSHVFVTFTDDLEKRKLTRQSVGFERRCFFVSEAVGMNT